MAQTPTEGSQIATQVGVPQAVSDVWDTPAVNLKVPRSKLPPKPHDGLEQGILDKVALAAAVDAQTKGQDPAVASNQVHQFADGQERKVADAVTQQQAQAQQGAGSVEDSFDLNAAQEQQGVKFQKEVDSIGFGDRAQAALQANTITAAIVHRMLDTAGESAKMTAPDFAQWYSKNRNEVEGGKTEDEISALREAKDDLDLTRIQRDQENDRGYWDTITKKGTAGGLSTFSFAATAGLVDPAGWVLGAGVGKVAQMVGVGARATAAAARAATVAAEIQAGRTAEQAAFSGAQAYRASMISKSGFTAAAVENGVGNALGTAALQAAGKHESATDYFNAVGTGMIFGTALHTLNFQRVRAPKGYVEPAGDEQIVEVGEALKQKGAADNVDLYTQAQEQAGPAATPDEIVHRATVIEAKNGQSIVDGLDEDVPAAVRMDAGTLPTEEVAPVVPPARTVGSEAPGRTYELPAELAKAAPNYGYGSKQFKLKFANDVDRAAYIIAQERPSTRDADYLKFVMDATGADELSARNYGKEVRRSIKAQAKGAKPGTLAVEEMFKKPAKESAATNNGSGESAASVEAQNRLRDEKAAGQTRMLIDRDGTVTELHGVDAVDTHARPGQVIVQRGIGKDEWTILSHGDDIGKDAVEGKVNVARARMAEHSVADDVETQIGEHFLDMGEDFGDAPKRTIHAEQELPADASVASEPVVTDRERAVLLGGDSGDNAQLFPRSPVSTGDEPTPLLTSPEEIARAAARHNLDVQVSNEGERAQLAELAERADRVVAENPIDEQALKTSLKWFGGETTSNTLLSSKVNALKAWAILTLENAQGAAGRRATASLLKQMREQAYMKNFRIELSNAYTAFRNARGGSALRDFADRKLWTEYNLAVAEAMERGRMGQDLSNLDANVRLGLEAARKVLKVAGEDQIYVGTVGAARLENLVADAYYLPRQFSAEQVAKMKPDELRGYVALLSKNMQENAGYDKKFADQLAIVYMERLKLRAREAYDSPMSPTDLGGHEVLKDALEAMQLSREEVQEALHKYARGGAKHTKERIPLNLLSTMVGADGKVIRLMDLANTDIEGLIRGYARRVSGEVALAKHGIMGEPGIKMIARLAIAQGASKHEMAAFWQTAKEMLGQPMGGKRGKWGDNLLAFTSSIRMGGMGITQVNDYSNGPIALGVKHAYASVPAIPRLRGEILAASKGKRVPNALLDPFVKYGLDFGVEGYTMHSMLDINPNFDVTGTGALTTLDRAIRAGSNANRIFAGHRAMVSVQIRGVAEQIIHRFIEKVKDGGAVNDKALLDMGFTPEVQAAFKRDMSRIVKTKQDGGVIFDMDEFSDVDNALRFMQSVQRGATQIVQEPHIGENSQWVHKEYVRFLTQFRHYGILSMEKQWGRQKFVHGSGKTLGYMLGAMSVALPIHMARVYAVSMGMSEKDRKKYIEDHTTWQAMSRATMNYVGASGILPDVLDMTAAGLGVPLTGGRWGGNSGSALGAIVPAAGALDDLYTATKGVGRVTGRVIKGRPPQWGLEAQQAAHLLPGSRLPYLQGLINMMNHK